MTVFDHQDNRMYFGALFVDPDRWMVTEQKEGFHEFG